MKKQDSRKFNWRELMVVLILSLMYYWIMTNSNTPFHIDYFSSILLFATTLSSGIGSVFVLRSSILNKYRTVFNTVFLTLITLVIGFMFVGQPLFLMQNTIDVNIEKLIYYIFVCLLIVPYEILFLYFLECFPKNRQKSTATKLIDKKAITKVRIIVFIIIFIVAFVALIGFYPGNMTSDSVDQWLQAQGLRNITTAHPALMAIVIRCITTFINTPFIIAFLQIIFFATVCSCFLSYLYSHGLPKKYIIIFTVIFSILPSNFMLLTTIWKDVVYTTSLLWITYLFVKIVIDGDAFYKKWYNVVGLIISFILLYFYRHNGIGPLVFGLLFLIAYALKYKNKVNYYIAASVLVLVVLINGPLFSLFDVQNVSVTNGNSMFSNLITRTSGLVLQNVSTLPDYTASITKRYASQELLKEYYNPFSNDTYAFNEKIINYQKGYKGVKKITTKQFALSYIELIKTYPTMVLKERLDGTNILWSIPHPSNGFNSRYAAGIWFPNHMTNDEWKVIEKFNSNISRGTSGIAYTNKIADIYKQVAKVSESYFVLDLLTWRGGIYLAALMLWFVYILNNNKKLVWIIVPLIGNTATWVVFLAYQTFRYVWYLQVVVLFIVLATLVFGEKKNPNSKIEV